MDFPETTDEDYIKFFSDIWDKGTFDNDFKFAFGRFLVEYCKQQNPNLHVSFASIAEYFLKYYHEKKIPKRVSKNLGPSPDQIYTTRHGRNSAYFFSRNGDTNLSSLIIL